MKMENLIRLCAEAPDIRAFAFFDEQKLVHLDTETDSSLHEPFVAIQQLASNIGEALGADELLDASFAGVNDQFYFRTGGFDEQVFYAVFKAGPKSDLQNLVESIFEDVEKREITIEEKVPKEEAKIPSHSEKRIYRGNEY